MEDAIQTAVAARTEAELSAELLAAARKRVEDLEHELASVTERCDLSERDNAAMNDTLSKLQTHLNSAGDEITELTEKNQAAATTNDRLSAQLESKEVSLNFPVIAGVVITSL